MSENLRGTKQQDRHAADFIAIYVELDSKVTVSVVREYENVNYNPAKYEELIKQCLRSILDISGINLLEFYDFHDQLRKWSHFCPHTLQLGTRFRRRLYPACQTGTEGGHYCQKPNRNISMISQ